MTLLSRGYGKNWNQKPPKRYHHTRSSRDRADWGSGPGSTLKNTVVLLSCVLTLNEERVEAITTPEKQVTEVKAEELWRRSSIPETVDIKNTVIDQLKWREVRYWRDAVKRPLG